MLTALSIILFISALNDEMSHVPKTDQDNEPIFVYAYGFSFFLCGASFVVSQCAAVCCISVYLRRHAHVVDMLRLIPGLGGTRDELEESTATVAHHHGSSIPSLKLHYPNVGRIYNAQHSSSPSNSVDKLSNSSLVGTAL